MAREVAPPEKQAEILRDQGNLYFKKERLGAAIEAYTEV
jgi:STIP1 family protein 1